MSIKRVHLDDDKVWITSEEIEAQDITSVLVSGRGVLGVPEYADVNVIVKGGSNVEVRGGCVVVHPHATAYVLLAHEVEARGGSNLTAQTCDRVVARGAVINVDGCKKVMAEACHVRIEFCEDVEISESLGRIDQSTTVFASNSRLTLGECISTIKGGSTSISEGTAIIDGGQFNARDAKIAAVNSTGTLNGCTALLVDSICGASYGSDIAAYGGVLHGKNHGGKVRTYNGTVLREQPNTDDLYEYPYVPAGTEPLEWLGAMNVWCGDGRATMYTIPTENGQVDDTCLLYPHSGMPYVLDRVQDRAPVTVTVPVADITDCGVDERGLPWVVVQGTHTPKKLDPFASFKA